MWADILFVFGASLVATAGGSYGLFKLGQFSQRQQIKQNIRLLEERIKKNDEEKDELSELLDEHKELLN